MQFFNAGDKILSPFLLPILPLIIAVDNVLSPAIKIIIANFSANEYNTSVVDPSLCVLLPQKCETRENRYVRSESKNYRNTGSC